MHCQRWFLGAIVFLVVSGCDKKDAPVVGKDSNSDPAVPAKSSFGVWKPFTSPTGSFRALYPWGNAVPYPFPKWNERLHLAALKRIEYRTELTGTDGDRFYNSDGFCITEVKFREKIY